MLAAMRVLPKYATPGPPVAGYVGWWDASDTSSITSSSGAVSQWNDKSGNGYHLLQSTAGNKPTTGTRTQNSLNVLDFNGSSNFLDTTTWSSQAQPTTVFAVAKGDATATQYNVFDTTSGRQNLYYRGTGQYGLWSGSAEVFGGTVNTNPHVFSCVFNGASSVLYLDGSSIATGNPGTNAASGQFRVGMNSTPGSRLDGWVAEIVFYPSALSTGGRQSVESYLKAKWGTP